MRAEARFQGWRWKLLIASAATLAGIGLCELALRVSGFAYPVFETYDPVRGFAPRPGKRGWYDKEGRAYLEINRYGYRDEEHSLAKPDGVFRILFLGDSFTEARQVDLQDTFWKQIERRLNADARMAGKRVEVISCAAGGYSTTQELLTLRLHGLAFEPDLVVLAMYMGNDLSGNSKRICSKQNLGTFQPFHVYQGSALVLDASFREPSLEHFKQRFMLTAIHHSRLLELVNGLRRKLYVRTLRRHKSEGEVILDARRNAYASPRSFAWAEAWFITQDLLLELKAEASAAGARFLVATLSVEDQVHPDAERRRQIAEALGVEDLFYSERRLRAFGAEHGIEVVTLAERMQAFADETGTYLHGFDNMVVGTGHWNLEAHRLAAEILAREILERGLAP